MIELNFEKMYSQMAGKNYPTDCIALNAGLYAISAGGKRFRFLLSLDTAKAFKNATNKNAHRLAVAVELIHNYSLIHDDLPCMDNADERRGLPSCQKKFGDTQAVLAGDGLLTSAIEIIVGGKAEQNYLCKITICALLIYTCKGAVAPFLNNQISHSGSSEKDISFPVFGCRNVSLWQNSMISQRSCAPYFPSPTKGMPREENCTRIWCVLPVRSAMRTRDISPAAWCVAVFTTS